MSSSPTAPISTTASSTSSHFLRNASADPAPPAGDAAGGAAPRAVVIACGALSGPIRDMIKGRNWPVELHNLPSLLHNQPAQIAPEVERLAVAALDRGLPV